jgi:SAM-dependent methyltransferase
VEQETWDRLFDELYLRTYAPRMDEERTEREARGAAALAGVGPGGDVLDAPCGYGRHALVLARDGHRVTGVDRSPVLLEEARRASGGAAWPRWVQGDLREPLPFADASFDAVLNLFSSFVGYYDAAADTRFVAEARRVLRPGGRFVLETMSRDRLMSRFSPRDWDRVPGGVVFDERRWEAVAGTVETSHELRLDDGERRSVTYRIRVFTATDIDALLRTAGFGHVEFFDSLAGGAPEPGSRITAVAS